MRRVHRRPLPITALLDLRRRQAASTPQTARDDWRSYRAVVASHPVVDTLARMAGIRQRCFYCRDSRAADVEHFIPIARDASRTFVWTNLLWVCPECNRRKVSQFPVEGGVPLLLNPVDDDPWDHLILDTGTGNLAPRFLAEAVLDRVGEETIKVIAPLNFESVTEGRRRAIRRLRAAVCQLISSGDDPDARRRLRQAVEDDDFGVAAWFFRAEGRAESPFAEFRASWPAVWRRFCAWSAREDHGIPETGL